MNFAIVRYLIGWLMGIESLFLLLPAFTAVIYREPELPAYIATALICMVGAGILCEYKPKNTKFYAREGFVAVALCWLVLAVTGALPFVLSREIPFAVDAIFEAASGFTTTGATILGDVEALSHASMLWRCLMHWVGGMGILVFMLIVLPLAGGQTIYLMRAESPGPSVSKISPHMRDTALILYAIYFGLTVLQIILLLFGGMPIFDAICVSLGTAGTGGFGNWNNSIAHYNSAYLQNVISVFMILFGINFNAYFLLLTRKFKQLFKIEEIRVYLGVIAVFTTLIAFNVRGCFGSLRESFHHSLFQVASIITTTGFSTVDFNQWPAFSKLLLVLLMVVTLKTTVSRRTRKALGDPRPHRLFLGHYGVFALIALLQSTVSLGGDLLFLRVQAVHPLLFMLSGWLASLVFSFFTYTMVVSFGNVGKAIGVLMLIVQISGANAAYPVQMLPDFIAKVSPLLPLTHAVTMMRAAIAGIYDMDYWRAAGMLLAFVPPLLLLGLLLRKPLVRFNQWYVAQVESTKVLS